MNYGTGTRRYYYAFAAFIGMPLIQINFPKGNTVYNEKSGAEGVAV